MEIIINNAGNWFCDYALQMLIQSSILITILYIIDLLIRKRIRAVVRYSMWLLVLVKLVLPTSLSVPTGIGYWFGPEKSGKPVHNVIEEKETDTTTETAITFENQPQAVIPTGKAQDISTPEPEQYLAANTKPATQIAAKPAFTAKEDTVKNAITMEGWLFLGWVIGTIILAITLLQRYSFVKSLIAQSKPASDDRILSLLEECKKTVGLSSPVELRFTSNMLSPAACGLRNYVVLMPEELIADLSSDKLRAVLLHELCHIKRGDLWLNMTQTLLQIINFYNPLLWLANAIIRGLREKAVDESVLSKMQNESQSYCNTLIDIAEIAFSRPTLALRLIGVVESKSALQDRIKHMVTRPIPHSARLGWISITAVFILAAVLLPMAKGYFMPQLNIGVNQVEEDQEKEYAPGLAVMEKYYEALMAEDEEALEKLTANADAASKALRLTFNDKEYFKRNIKYETEFRENDSRVGYIPNTISDKDAGIISRYGIFTIGPGRKGPMRFDSCRYDIKTSIIPNEAGQWQIIDSQWIRRDLQWDSVNSLRNSHTTNIVYNYMKRLYPDKNIPRSEITKLFNNLDSALEDKLGYKKSINQYPGTFGWRNPENAGNIESLIKYTDILNKGFKKGEHYDYYDYLFETLESKCNLTDVVPNKIFTNNYFATIILENVTRKDGQPYIPALFLIAWDNKNQWLMADYCWLGENDIQVYIDGFCRSFPDVKEIDPQQQVTNKYIANLDNDISIELVGISKYPDIDNIWWSANGQKISKPDGKYYTSEVSDKYGIPYQFKFHITNFSDDINLSVDVNPAQYGSTDWENTGTYLDAIKLACIAPEVETVSMTIGLASEPWTTIATLAGDNAGVVQKNEYIFNFSDAMDINGDVVIIVSNNMDIHPFQLLAIDKNNNEYLPYSNGSRSSNEVRQSTFKYRNIAVADIKEFQVQVRPSSYVKFNNISLRPDKKTKPEIRCWKQKLLEKTTDSIKSTEDTKESKNLTSISKKVNSPSELIGKWTMTDIKGDDRQSYSSGSLDIKPDNHVILEGVQDGEYFAIEATYQFDSSTGRLEISNSTGKTNGYLQGDTITLIVPEENIKVTLKKAAIIKTNPKNGVLAVVKDFYGAVQTEDANKLINCMYIENQEHRNSLQALLKEFSPELQSIKIKSPEIVEVYPAGDGKYHVLTLIDMGHDTYVPQKVVVTTEPDGYKIMKFGSEELKQTQLAREMSARDYGLMRLNKQKDIWEKADNIELEKLYTNLITDCERNLEAARYAKEHDINIIQNFTKAELTKQLETYKSHTPEEFRQIVIDEYEQFQNTPEPASNSKASKI